MAIVGTILAVIGYIIMLVFGIILLVKAFQKSVGWGLIYLLTGGIGALVFVIKFWPETKSAFLKQIVGLVIAIVGAVIGGIGAAKSMPPIDLNQPIEAAPAQP